MYYKNKIDSLRDIFDTKDIEFNKTSLKVNNHIYPVVNDVIIILDPPQYTPALTGILRQNHAAKHGPADFSREIQYSFSQEWQTYPAILPEHESEFHQYFDLVNLEDLREKRICDLGCGMGRWSYFLMDRCRELILIDFSEAIFTARKNLHKADNILYFMCDLRHIPFKRDFCDLIFCLGVLHHLPVPALEELRALKKYSPRILVYLYYALDNRPGYFRLIFEVVNGLRIKVSGFKAPLLRAFLAWFFTIIFYVPLLMIGSILGTAGFSHYVPLYDTYRGKTLRRISQDAYDRFFTSIEQRYSKKQILELMDTYPVITVSDGLPYWHFLCER